MLAFDSLPACCCSRWADARHSAAQRSSTIKLSPCPAPPSSLHLSLSLSLGGKIKYRLPVFTSCNGRAARLRLSLRVRACLVTLSKVCNGCPCLFHLGRFFIVEVKERTLGAPTAGWLPDQLDIPIPIPTAPSWASTPWSVDSNCDSLVALTSQVVLLPFCL